MPYRLTRIYTRTGDNGHTNLGKERLSKDHPLIESLGTLDELNCAVGLVLSFGMVDHKISEYLTQIQQELFDIGGELAEPRYHAIKEEHVLRLEQIMDEWNALLPPLKEFILPRGMPSTVACHLARTICRRAERCLVNLHQEQPLKNLQILSYMNRLSDFLFVAARVISQTADGEEMLWEHKRG